MPKVLFTADWHIKLGQKNVPINWQKNRYMTLFDIISNKAKEYNVSTVIIGGDIFDRMPNIEELELYFSFVAKMKDISDIKVIIYSGNHEAVKKDTTFLTNLKAITKAISSNVDIIDEIVTIDNIDYIPYNRLKYFVNNGINNPSNILCTHVRGEIPPHVKPEIDLNKLSSWDIVLAGDLHSHSNTQLNIIYPGSPLTTSFHRKLTTTGVVVLDTSTKVWEFVEIDLPQLIRKTVSSEAEMVQTDYNHTIYELEGDISDLASINIKNDLLDKKIVKKVSESSLALKSTMSLEDEVRLYLTSILKLDQEKINEVLNLLNDSTIKEAILG